MVAVSIGDCQTVEGLNILIMVAYCQSCKNALECFAWGKAVK